MKLLDRLPADKKLHLIAGFAIAIVVALFCGLVLGASIVASTGAGVLLALGAGLAKEWRDKATGRGTPEYEDLWFTALGGFAGALVAQALIHLLR